MSADGAGETDEINNPFINNFVRIFESAGESLLLSGTEQVVKKQRLWCQVIIPKVQDKNMTLRKLTRNKDCSI